MRYAAARLYEQAGELSSAVHEYGEILAGCAEYEDAVQRRAALWERCEEEKQRAALSRDDAALERAVLRVRAARGPAGRSAAVAKGLTELALPETRGRLRSEALGIEVQAVLDKVAGLRTRAARLRNLQVAILTMDVREVPEEAGRQHMQRLHDALAALRER